MLPQHQDFVLDVLIDDDVRGIFQVWFHRLDHAFRIERALSGRAAHGEVVAEARLPTEGPADDLGPERIDVRRFEIDGESPLFAELADKVGQRRLVIDDLKATIARWIDVGGRAARWRRRSLGGRCLLPFWRCLGRLAQHEGLFLRVGLAEDRGLAAGGSSGFARIRQERLLGRADGAFAPHLVGEPAKTEIGKQLPQPFAIGLSDAGRLPIDVDRQLGVELDQLAAGAGLIGEVLQVLFEFGARGLVGVLQHLFQRAELLQERGGFLRADEGNAGDVVDGVADERLKVDHLVGPHAPVEQERVRVVEGILAHVEDLNERPQELADVLVAGDDPRVNSALAGQTHDGGDDVVRFPTRIPEGGNAEALQHLDDFGNLRREVDGDFGAVGFVFGVDLVAGGRTGNVEGADQIGRAGQGADHLQVAGEAKDGVRRLAARSGHFRDRMEDLKDKRIEVDDKQRLGHQILVRGSRPRGGCSAAAVWPMVWDFPNLAACFRADGVEESDQAGFASPFQLGSADGKEWRSFPHAKPDRADRWVERRPRKPLDLPSGPFTLVG